MNLGYDVTGYINNSEFVENSNGAINAVNNIKITIIGTLFENNFFHENAFDGGSAVITHGGALSLAFGSTALIYDSQFMGNRAEDGGAIAAAKSSLFIQSCIFSGNHALHGGAILLDNSVTLILINHGNGSVVSGSKTQTMFNITPVHINIVKSHFINKTVSGALKPHHGINEKEEKFAAKGGAISIRFTEKVTIAHSIFTGNSAFSIGGALSVTDNTTLIITNTLFDQNWAFNGGAIYASKNVNITLSNSTVFRNNSASICENSDQQCIDKYTKGTKDIVDIKQAGGAILTSYNVTLVINDSAFTENEAKSGGGLYLDDDIMLTMNACNFNNNKGKGASIFSTRNKYAVINNTNFSNNISPGAGNIVCVYMKSAIFTIVGCHFTNNIVTGFRSAIYIRPNMTLIIIDSSFNSNSVNMDGGAVTAVECSVYFQNSYFTENVASSGSVISTICTNCEDKGGKYSLSIQDCVLANNSAHD